MPTTTFFARIFTLATMAALAALLGGCANSPRLDRHFGDSLRLTRAQQTLNPAARLNNAPVNGLDGPAARSAYDSYQRSFATPEQPSGGFTIGSGGVTSR
ncbi:MAG: hypothetical protein ABW202_09500 [Duganella sp.]